MDSRSPLQYLTFFTALLFGFTMLTRASNYLPISSAAYHLDTEHIAFTVAPPPRCWGSYDRSDGRPAGRYSPSPHHRCFSFLSQIKDGLERQRTSDSLSSSRGSSAGLCLRHSDYSLRICYRSLACPGQARVSSGPCHQLITTHDYAWWRRNTVWAQIECTLIRYASVAPQSWPPHKFPTM